MRGTGARLTGGYAIWLEEQGVKNWRDYFKPSDATTEGVVWTLPEAYHYNTWITERAEARLKAYQEKGENFFLWVSHPDPHGPNVAPERWAKRLRTYVNC